MRFWFAFLGLTAAALAAPAAKPPILESALKHFRAEGAFGWAFTQTTSGDGHSRIERFDPARPDFQRWELLQQDGRAPTEDELREYREKQTRRSTAAAAPRIVDHLDWPSLQTIAESPDDISFRCNLLPDGDRDSAAQHLEVVVTVNKSTQTIVRVQLASKEPFSPALGVKIAEMKTVMTYSLPTADRPSLLEKVTTRLRGRAFLFKSLDADLVVTFSEQVYAGKKH